MHTVNLKLCPKSLDFTLKSFWSVWLLPESLRNKHVQLVIRGLAPWLVLVPYWEELRGLHMLVSVATCACAPKGKRLFTCFSMSFHPLHCQARADVVAFCLICGRPGIDAWYAARPSSQLQMFPVKPAKQFRAPQLRCKVRPCCKINLKAVFFFSGYFWIVRLWQIISEWLIIFC